MGEKTTDTSSVESESYFESLSIATIKTMYRPKSPDYDPHDESPTEETTKKDRKRKQTDNPRPATRSRKAEEEREKEREGTREGAEGREEGKDGGTQTDPVRAIQTEPGEPSRTPLPPSAKVKRARIETESRIKNTQGYNAPNNHM